MLLYKKVSDICHENLNIIKNSNSAHFDLPNELFLFLGCIWQYKESKGVSLLASPDLWNKFSTKEHICCISIMVIIEMGCFFFSPLQIKSPSYVPDRWCTHHQPTYCQSWNSFLRAMIVCAYFFFAMRSMSYSTDLSVTLKNKYYQPLPPSYSDWKGRSNLSHKQNYPSCFVAHIHMLIFFSLVGGAGHQE